MATTPTFLYRTLSPGGDPLRGNGALDFLSGLPAVVQAIQTSLLLLQGEWWESLSTGTPLFQSILGVPNTSNGVALLLRQRILSVPYVTGVTNLVVLYGGSSRAYTFSCTVSTAFGTITIASQPLPGLTAANLG